MLRDAKQYNIFVLIRRSAETEGVWLAELPEIDASVEGRTPSEALACATEAAYELIVHDLNEGIDPMRYAAGVEQKIERTIISDLIRTTPRQEMTPWMMDAAQETLDLLVVRIPVHVARHVPDEAEFNESPVETWPRRDCDQAASA